MKRQRSHLLLTTTKFVFLTEKEITLWLGPLIKTVRKLMMEDHFQFHFPSHPVPCLNSLQHMLCSKMLGWSYLITLIQHTTIVGNSVCVETVVFKSSSSPSQLFAYKLFKSSLIIRNDAVKKVSTRIWNEE